MATTSEALKSAETETPCRVKLLIDKEVFFDECVPSQQAKRFLMVADSITGSDDQYQQLTDRLVDLIEDPLLPEEAAELLDDAATDFINQYNAVNPKFVRKRFAQACMNANEGRSDDE